ncbi:MAG: murein hydrolase activator EnvC family protein [Myxococcota bacterium]
MFDNKKIWWFAALAVSSIAVAATAQARSFVGDLHRLETQIHEEEREASAAGQRLELLDARLSGDTASLETVRRAKLRVRRRVGERLVAWQRANRKLDRAETYLPPGAAADTRTLLGYAEPRAIGKYRRDIEVLGEIDREERKVSSLVRRRARSTIELAQSRADAGKTRAERDAVVEDARENEEQVDEEIEASDKSLARSLSMLVKNESERDFHRLKGTLLPPVVKPQTHGYGPRKQRGSMSYVRHTGVTWKVDRGAEVRATASGLVSFASHFEGYGKLVIIDHGNDYHSLYAHLSKVDVEVGERISRGEALGETGATGSFEGPKLYFELRKDGKPIDPADWFIQK